MKANQKGFSVVEILVVIVVVGLLGAVGWLVYDRQRDKTEPVVTKTETVVTKTETQKNSTDNAPTKDTSVSEDSYLTIKEWGVRFKLNADAKGSYYKLRQEGQYVYADVFNSNFDALKNKNGVQCKNELMFVVARYSENDPRLDDPINPKPAGYIKGYGYTGMAAYQAPPNCSFINEDPNANAEYDEAVLEAFDKYKKALTESFKSLEAI